MDLMPSRHLQERILSAIGVKSSTCDGTIQAQAVLCRGVPCNRLGSLHDKAIFIQMLSWAYPGVLMIWRSDSSALCGIGNACRNVRGSVSVLRWRLLLIFFIEIYLLTSAFAFRPALHLEKRQLEVQNVASMIGITSSVEGVCRSSGEAQWGTY